MKVTLTNVRNAAVAAGSVSVFCRSVLSQGREAIEAFALHLTTVATESKKLRESAERLYVSFSKEANAQKSEFRIRVSRQKDDDGTVTGISFALSEGGKIRAARQPGSGRSRAVAPSEAEVSKAQTAAAEAVKRAGSLADQLRRLELALSHLGLSAERIGAIRDGSADPASARHVPAAAKPAAKPNGKPAAAAQPAPKRQRSAMQGQRDSDAPAAAAAA